ncbi:MAG TPA: histidinol-phosphate transaminase [Candidatus Krumholzibacteria bacterium]|nr:histidinol-phosphate transaminase [Candidatus Krumholzibacteria bacterium]
MDIERFVRPGIRDIQRYEPGEDHPGAIKLSSNENPRPPHPKIIAAVNAALTESNRYPLSGSPALTAALARHHGVTPDDVMVGNGSNEIIDLLVRAFVAPDENVVFPVPSFIVYALIAKVCGVRGVGIPCRDYRLDLDAMRAAIDAKTRMVFVCNPNNPTSTYVNAAEVDAFLAGVPDDVMVVMDEAYIDYVDARDYPDSLALRRRRDGLIVLRTFSKFFAVAGVRVGYAIADPRVIDTLHRVRQPFNVSRLAQAAGLAALECAAELRPMAEEIIVERARVRAAIVELGLACPPSQANFVFVDTGDAEIDLFGELARRGVIVRRLGQFGAAHATYRISIGTPAENDALIGALQDIFHHNPAAGRARPAR